MTPGILQWKIGDHFVTTLNDGFSQVGIDLIRGLDHEEAFQIQRASFRTDQPKITFNAFLIQSANHPPILVDTGMGFMGGVTSGRLLPALQLAGVSPEEIRTILLTHLHPDHSAGLSDVAGSAVFPNAEIWMDRREHAFWTNDDNFTSAPGEFRAMVSQIQASIAPYGNRTSLFDGKAEVAPHVQSVPLYGHTPGHTGFRESSGDAAVFIWGDIVHFPEIQSRKPETSLILDVNQAQAVETRKMVLEETAAKRVLVAGMHIDFPAFSFVEKVGDGFRLAPALWADYW